MSESWRVVLWRLRRGRWSPVGDPFPSAEVAVALELANIGNASSADLHVVLMQGVTPST